MAAVNSASAAMQNAMQEHDGTYTAEDKWDVFVEGPSGMKLEVTVRPTQVSCASILGLFCLCTRSLLTLTVRPTQKARLLLKAWIADQEVPEGDAASYSLAVGNKAVTGDEEIGQVLSRGGVVSVVKA